MTPGPASRTVPAAAWTIAGSRREQRLLGCEGKVPQTHRALAATVGLTSARGCAMASGAAEKRPGSMEMIATTAQDVRATPIGEFIYLSPGTSNSYLVKTDDGDVLIDAGMDFEAPTHRRKFAVVSEGPLRYIVLTQGHVDHVGGVGEFREQGTRVIAQRNSTRCQADDRRIAGYHLWRTKVFFGLGARVTAPELIEPDIAFDESYAFELGGRRFELHAAPGGETIDSCCVHLPEHGIVFSGNILGPLFPTFPNLYTIRGDKYRFADAYIETVEMLLGLQPETLITGHFDPIQGREHIATELTRLRDAVAYVLEQTLRGMNAGKSPFELMREVRLPAALAVDERYGKVEWGVRAIFEGYGGWFHFDSTTVGPAVARQLLSQPPWAVAALAGAEALAERARERLGAGRPGEAIQLAEMALAGEPGQRAALEVYRAAHEALLAGAGRTCGMCAGCGGRSAARSDCSRRNRTRRSGHAPTASRGWHAG